MKFSPERKQLLCWSGRNGPVGAPGQTVTDGVVRASSLRTNCSQAATFGRDARSSGAASRASACSARAIEVRSCFTA
ncbi:MAG: hypothetical protein ABIF71_08985 [Planctomycetota bacterium]